MNLKRAVLISMAAYIASFVIGIVTGLLFGLDFSDPQAIVPPEVWYSGAISSMVLMASFAYWYFKGKGLKASLEHGFKFGLVSVITGFGMDAVILAPMALSGDFTQAFHYYSDWRFWATIVIIIITTSLTGKYLAKKG